MVDTELSTLVLVAGGMLMGILAVGSIMTVLGAIFGTAFDPLVPIPITPRTPSRGEECRHEA